MYQELAREEGKQTADSTGQLDFHQIIRRSLAAPRSFVFPRSAISRSKKCVSNKYPMWEQTRKDGF